MAWIAAYTEAQRERIAVANIKAQGHATYMPVIEQKNGKLIPLFPRYVFVNTPGIWRFLTGTRGVLRPIMTGESPAIVSAVVIRELKAREREGIVQLEKKPIRLRFKTGDQARVNARKGDLSAFNGQIVLYEGMTEDERHRVLLSIFGRSSEIVVDDRDLEEVE